MAEAAAAAATLVVTPYVSRIVRKSGLSQRRPLERAVGRALSPLDSTPFKEHHVLDLIQRASEKEFLSLSPPYTWEPARKLETLGRFFPPLSFFDYLRAEPVCAFTPLTGSSCKRLLQPASSRGYFICLQ